MSERVQKYRAKKGKLVELKQLTNSVIKVPTKVKNDNCQKLQVTSKQEIYANERYVSNKKFYITFYLIYVTNTNFIG